MQQEIETGNQKCEKAEAGQISLEAQVTQLKASLVEA